MTATTTEITFIYRLKMTETLVTNQYANVIAKIDYSP